MAVCRAYSHLDIYCCFANDRIGICEIRDAKDKALSKRLLIYVSHPQPLLHEKTYRYMFFIT